MKLALFKNGPPPGRRRTDRFPSYSELEVPQDDYEGKPIIIEFGEGLGNPISAKAVKIKAMSGDVLVRRWFDKDKGKPMSIPTVLFAFVDISALKDAYKNKVDKASLDIEFFEKVFANEVIVVRLFEKAISMCKDEKVPEQERNAIRNVLRLVAATTLNTRSTLIQGEERLGQVPYPEASPNPGNPSPPSVQSKSILHY